jgi:hypothetical protein
MARNLKKTQYIVMITSGLEFFVCGLPAAYWNTRVRGTTIYSG